MRLLGPRDGQAVFSHVRGKLGRSGSREAAAFRGEEMMQGRERALLEQAIWDDAGKGQSGQCTEGFEAELDAGDGLFIPKGWWHSIKGMGKSVTASVSHSSHPILTPLTFPGQLVVSLAISSSDTS